MSQGDDLSGFARYGRLDAYELTDDELAHLVERWRRLEWSRRCTPSAPDFDVNDAAQRLQRHLAKVHNIEVEYNTALLLKQELEPLMYLRVLVNVPRALSYFLRPRHLWVLIQSIRRVRRYSRTPTPTRERPPNLLKRPYWRQLSPYSFEERKRMDYWW